VLPRHASGMNPRDAGLGAFAVLLGIVVAVIARGFPGGSAYDVLGPRLLPYIIAAGLILTGLPILLGAFRRARRLAPEPWDVVPLLLIALALIVPIVLIQRLGWIPVCAVVFAIGARAFGSRRVGVDLAIGLVFGGITYLLFNHVLGLNLPLGSLVAGLMR
jgi:putative tricarboxylic transport membrane protein